MAEGPRRVALLSNQPLPSLHLFVFRTNSKEICFSQPGGLITRLLSGIAREGVTSQLCQPCVGGRGGVRQGKQGGSCGLVTQIPHDAGFVLDIALCSGCGRCQILACRG